MASQRKASSVSTDADDLINHDHNAVNITLMGQKYPPRLDSQRSKCLLVCAQNFSLFRAKHHCRMTVVLPNAGHCDVTCILQKAPSTVH
ncbi:hypothetical protein H257_01976 [Aphanomyces astaci]|uniref:Uncharacterized protein n=1 Tax=Aphanomyces astaci TaxID=112090 RepID=W4H763_APHAT|nr:hypothetical protein H257_01976 [Aphanomyces astaci]ETV86953.1 hypothetical protein H257_01976 [Aphanomyces astaci]|eukprot:XP_009823752.1 hypothetical protein H257_01976 [Aphanomyces astaci]